MKESRYSASRLSYRLSAKEESSIVFSDDVPAYLRRKPEQGKGDL
jgi:hypothetical protein